MPSEDPISASPPRRPSGRRHTRRRLAGILIAFALPLAATATGVYQAPDDFLNEVFAGSPPDAQALWLTADLRRDVSEILGHPPATMRVRYWKQGERTAWIVEEIGKEKPITTGIVIAAGRIESVKVLVFRESRGWEVRHDFFTDQFREAGLSDDGGLDRHIDSISGATLSVNAVTRLARMVLYLDARVLGDDSA